MIELYNISKNYDDICALDRINASFGEHGLSVVHMASGSGKTTLVRIIGGIVRPDEGVVVVDDMPIYDNPVTKKRMALITTDTSFGPFANMYAAARRLSGYYTQFDGELLQELCSEFDIDPGRMFIRMNAGDKTAAYLLLAVCTHVKYIVCDDILSGLDDGAIDRANDIIAYALWQAQITPVMVMSDTSLVRCTTDHVYEF